MTGIPSLLFVAALGQPSVDESTVRRILERAHVIDLHSDTTQLILDKGFDLGKRHDHGQVDIPRMREGGYTAMFFRHHRMILFGEQSLRRAVAEFIHHYHRERNHQGLENALIESYEYVGSLDGNVRCRKRLGGMLNYYYREAA